MGIKTIIIYYLSIIFSSLIMLKIYENYSDKKLEINKNNTFKIMIMSMAFFFNNIYMINIFKILFAAILTFLMFKWIFKDNNRLTIDNTLFITIILYILDLLLAIFLPLGIKNIEMLNHSIFFKVGYSIIVNLILYIITTNKSIINIFFKIRKMPSNKKMLYIIYFAILIICNIWLFYLANDTSNKILNIILGVTEVIITFFAIIIIRSEYKQNILKIKEEQLTQNLKLYLKVSQEYRELKHNLMNDLLIIKTKVKKSDQDFVNGIINKYRSNYEWVNCITDIPEGIQGLIFLKKTQAEMNEITFNLEYNISKNIEKNYKINKNFKLYEALGILFDNAIEASKASEQKLINVEFSLEDDILHIIIFNTFSNSIDINKIGNKNYSTKNRGSGIGLNYIKNRRNKFKITQTIRNDIFITDIALKANKKK